MAELKRGERRRLPSGREAVTRQFDWGGKPFFVTVGFFEDGTVGEVFLSDSVDRYGAISMLVSLALQYGVPLEALQEKLAFRPPFNPQVMSWLVELKREGGKNG